MKTFRISFPRRVRIHGGECGAVARALHHAAQKEALMPYERLNKTLISDECVLLSQAELEKASNSTFNERKQMSTKTTLKRIALVAVSALGFGLLSVAPSNAASTFNATFSAPTAYDTQTSLVGGSNTVANVGSITMNMSTLSEALVPSTDTATVTLTGAGAAIDTNFLNALSLSLTVSGTTDNAGTTSAYNNAAGYNPLNNGSVTISGKSATLTPAAANFGLASGKVYVNVARANLASTDTGAKVYMDLTVSSAGVIQTFRQTLTLTVGSKAGTASTPVATGIVNAGATVTATHTQPYTNVAAGGTVSPTAFSLTDTISVGDPTFDVTAVVTGGSATLVRTNATTITPTLLKNALAGSMSVTYTISVTVPASAVAGETVSVYGYTWTVQPYTPSYSYSVVTEAANSNGYYASKASGGDGIVWGSASATAGQTATITVVQKDQNAATIAASAYAKSVTATITGKGSLAALGANGEVTKTQSWNSVLGNLSGTTTINVFPEGTSGEGTLVVSVDGTNVATYNLRFYGAAASIEAKLIRPIGSSAGATNGVDGSASSASALGTTVATASATTATAIAVSVKDSNGYVIPTATAPAAVISDRSVVTTATSTFVDSGVGLYSAGTFVRHYTYTTNANASGKTSTVTFTFLNSSGTLLSASPLTVTLGGAVAKATISFGSKTTFTPGEQLTVTFSGLDAAGNKAYDGQDVLAGGFDSTLDFGGANDNFMLGSYWTTAVIVNGSKSRVTYAPAIPGEWTLTGYLANLTEYSATANVSGGATVAAAEAAADAAAEAIDAANAATDAANLAAEAADAATVAAEEARDAADAATAAVEELATQVATLMAALKAQITTLANTVAKIAKKVKA